MTLAKANIPKARWLRAARSWSDVEAVHEIKDADELVHCTRWDEERDEACGRPARHRIMVKEGSSAVWNGRARCDECVEKPDVIATVNREGEVENK